MAEISLSKMSQGEFSNMSRPFSNDMIDFFKLVQDAAEEIVRKAEKEGWDENKLIKEISGII